MTHRVIFTIGVVLWLCLMTPVGIPLIAAALFIEARRLDQRINGVSA